MTPVRGQGEGVASLVAPQFWGPTAVAVGQQAACWWAKVELRK
jgi:hypothetical protein